MRSNLEKNDQELNRNRSSFKLNEKIYKVPLPVAAIFILAAFFIITFSFVVDDSCPKSKPDCSKDDRRNVQIQNLSPLFISYGFLFIGLLFWYFFYFWWDTVKKQREANILRIAADSEQSSEHSIESR
jgi:hypothetical protein